MESKNAVAARLSIPLVRRSRTVSLVQHRFIVALGHGARAVEALLPFPPHPIFFNARNSLPRVTPSALAAAT
jgi:hypothetical protein